MNKDSTMNVDFIEPGYDAFFDNPVRNTFEICWWCPLFFVIQKFEYFLEKSQLSFSLYLANRHRAALQKKKIQSLTRSYRRSFQRFNDTSVSTFIEESDEGYRVRDKIHCKTNRNIQLKK